MNNKKALRNSLIARGLIMIIFFIGMIFYSCTVDENKQEATQIATQVPSTKKIIRKEAIVKKIQTVQTTSGALKITSIDQEGHDVDITTYYISGVGCAVDHSHDSGMCRKCRIDRCFPAN